MSAVLLAVTLMQPGDFTGLWAFQSRLLPRVSVLWGAVGPEGERLGRAKGGETVVAFSDADFPLAVGVVDADTCVMFVATRTSRNHRHVRGRVYVASPTCDTILTWGPFRAHQRRP